TPLLFLDTVKIRNSSITLNAKFDTVSLQRLLKKVLPSYVNIDGKISGYIFSSGKDSIIKFSCFSPKITINSVGIDSINCKGYFISNGINIEKVSFERAPFVNFKGDGFIPWSTFSEHSEDRDTLRVSIKADGDFLAAIENSFKSPIGGSGKGKAEISFYSTEGNWVFTKGIIEIPDGLLKVKPFVPDNIKKFNFLMRIDSNCIVHTDMSGIIKKRPIRVFSEHNIPEGYEPFVIGPLNFGVLQVITPKKGVDLHLVGFMAIKDKGDIEFKGKKPFANFTLSGPIDRLKITGVWIVRDMDFTFPLLTIEKLDYKFDPFPYVTWDLDLYPGNRKVMYFWDVTGKKNRLVRFLECYLDPSSFLNVRGRDLDKDFRVYGSLRSYRGAFYYGRTFNRNLEIGVDFVPIKKDDGSGYDNMPILWGSAEAFSDSSRYDRIKITCMVEDPVTGTVSEKGRLKEQFPPNIIFNLSSNFEGIPDETELEFYRSAGIKFSSIEGTGSAVSDLGEQLFHTYLLQKWERFIAKKLGLDVMNIETSIVSNYFNKLYSRRFTSLFDESDYMAFANIGVTIGRYFFRDYLLLKARSELIPVNMMLTPEYSIGFELQPTKYFIMDINYGVNIRESKIFHSPLLMMQLRLPISSMRKFFNF
ncbi:MAG: hypothetical protein N2053_06045, partial [Chitinispirillaceae bacterium]|nr:hypothetical protein [Chitinispirillaceae bacterium]